MIKSEALEALSLAEGELILAELDIEAARLSVDRAATALEMATRRFKDASRDAILHRQIADSFDRGGRHTADIEDFRQRLRDYISERGPVEHMAIEGVSKGAWDKLSEENKISARATMEGREERIEMDILAGFRDRYGNYLQKYAHLAYEESDPVVESILQGHEEDRLRDIQIDNSVMLELAPAEAPEKPRYRYSTFGKRILIKPGDKIK